MAKEIYGADSYRFKRVTLAFPNQITIIGKDGLARTVKPFGHAVFKRVKDECDELVELPRTVLLDLLKGDAARLEQ